MHAAVLKPCTVNVGDDGLELNTDFSHSPVTNVFSVAFRGAGRLRFVLRELAGANSLRRPPVAGGN